MKNKIALQGYWSIKAGAVFMQDNFLKLHAQKLLSYPQTSRIACVELLVSKLKAKEAELLEENFKDLERAKKENLSPSLIERMELTPARLSQLQKQCLEVIHGPVLVGELGPLRKREDGLILQQERIPLGALLMIFESRPMVMVEAFVLSLHSGNALYAKGGKEAQCTNAFFATLINESVSKIFPYSLFCALETREDVSALLTRPDLIDAVIARGSSTLVASVKKHSLVPVIAHDKGLCHLYLHADAPEKMSLDLILNGKLSRPGVCNATETLLIHHAVSFKQTLFTKLIEAGASLKGCAQCTQLDPRISLASSQDYATEYLNPTLSVKIVQSLEEACAHIHTYGSHHTEAICTLDSAVFKEFSQAVDASCIMHNASTRFNDAFELGYGAELGISTSKFHAYGAMGAVHMTTWRTLVKGSGHVR
jgi:glutamate-5-semialdehyde dehydrogenase